MKTRVKKAADVEKKLVEKQDKAREQARAQNQSLSFRKLALSNSRSMEFSTFKEILSDPPIGPGDDFRHDDSSAQILESPTAEALTVAKLTGIEKKRAKEKTVVDRFSPSKKKPRPPSPPSVAMKLIRPGKQKVKVLANTVESTPPKRMRQATGGIS